MGANLLERGFHPPAGDEPPEDAVGSSSRSVQRNACGSCSPVGSRTSTQRIALAEHRPCTRPRCRRRLQLALLSAVPFGHRDGVQTVFRSARTALSLGRRLPFSGPTALAFPAPRGRLVQTGIQPQPGDHTDVAAHRGQQFNAGKPLSATNTSGDPAASVWFAGSPVAPSRSASCAACDVSRSSGPMAPAWSGMAAPNAGRRTDRHHHRQ